MLCTISNAVSLAAGILLPPQSLLAASTSSLSALTTALGQQRRRLLRLPAVASQLPIQMPPLRAQVAVTSEQADLPAQRFAEAAPS